jgi:hypothetical protein
VALPAHAEGMQLLCSQDEYIRKRDGQVFLDKYLMHIFQASVRSQVKGRSQVIKTEVRTMNAQDPRRLLWAQWEFHWNQSGPSLINIR